jgi:hypothetical protein
MTTLGLASNTGPVTTLGQARCAPIHKSVSSAHLPVTVLFAQHAGSTPAENKYHHKCHFEPRTGMRTYDVHIESQNYSYVTRFSVLFKHNAAKVFPRTPWLRVQCRKCLVFVGLGRNVAIVSFALTLA